MVTLATPGELEKGEGIWFDSQPQDEEGCLELNPCWIVGECPGKRTQTQPNWHDAPFAILMAYNYFAIILFHPFNDIH
jgi:hypothetical protein